MEDYFVELAEKELRGPFKRTKIEIVRQSMPALLVCGADEELICDEKAFGEKVVENTNYDVKGFIPQFILIAIISGVVQWLVKRFLDRHF